MWAWLLMRRDLWKRNEEEWGQAHRKPTTVMSGVNREKMYASITPSTVAGINKRTLAKAPEPEPGVSYSGHSLRAGGATQAILNGVPIAIVCKYGGWREVSTVLKAYIQNLKVDMSTLLQGAGGDISSEASVADEVLVEKLRALDQQRDQPRHMEAEKWTQQFESYDDKADKKAAEEMIPPELRGEVMEDEEEEAEEEDRAQATRAMRDLDKEVEGARPRDEFDETDYSKVSAQEFQAEWERQTLSRLQVPDGKRRRPRRSYAGQA